MTPAKEKRKVQERLVQEKRGPFTFEPVKVNINRANETCRYRP